MRNSQRKQQLLLKIAGERAVLSQQLQPLERPLAVVDKAVEAVRYLQRHPAPLFAAALLLGILRPKKTFRILQRGFGWWRWYRKARNALLSL